MTARGVSTGGPRSRCPSRPALASAPSAARRLGQPAAARRPSGRVQLRRQRARGGPIPRIHRPDPPATPSRFPRKDPSPRARAFAAAPNTTHAEAIRRRRNSGGRSRTHSLPSARPPGRRQKATTHSSATPRRQCSRRRGRWCGGRGRSTGRVRPQRVRSATTRNRPCHPRRWRRVRASSHPTRVEAPLRSGATRRRQPRAGRWAGGPRTVAWAPVSSRREHRAGPPLPQLLRSGGPIRSVRGTLRKWLAPAGRTSQTLTSLERPGSDRPAHRSCPPTDTLARHVSQYADA